MRLKQTTITRVSLFAYVIPYEGPYDNAYINAFQSRVEPLVDYDTVFHYESVPTGTNLEPRGFQ